MKATAFILPIAFLGPTCLSLAGCGSSPPLAAVEPVSRAEPEAPEETAPTMPTPPIAKQVPYQHETHGHTRSDPYFWLRDDDRQDPEVLAYLEAENRYAEAALEPLRSLRESLYEEIVARIPQDDSTVPYSKDGFFYYTRYEEGKEYEIHCRKAGSLEAEEQVILDANERAEGHAYYAVRGLKVSGDGRTLAFAEDTVSRRIYTYRFKNLETGELYPDALEGASPSAAWAADGRTLFYVRKEEGTLREYQVWRHRLGTEQAEDVLVYEEEDPEFYMSVFLSRSRDFVMLGSYQTQSHEYRYVDARRPTAPPEVVLPREEAHEYDVEHWNGRFYIRTNWQAQDFRLMSVPPRQSADKARWRVEIEAREGVFLRGFQLFEDFLVASERRGGLTGLRVAPWARGGRVDLEEGHDIAFDEGAYVVGFGTNAEPATSTLRFTFESMTTPDSVYDYDMRTRERERMKQLRVGGDYDPSAYVSSRFNAVARDGTEVPISLVHRRDLDRSVPQPLLLYGYGSYGHSLDPSFVSSRISLLDRGFIFAIAHVRGGQEMGRAWYEAGKLLQKQNTFSDFVDCGERLVADGYTQPDRLFAWGGSAGGLLMGAVANMRPDLFHGIVADVPFVDVVTTMLDDTIPLTTFEYDEWGNPNQPDFYEYMLSYSPYDNVTAQAYPHMLVLTGLHDSQVQYWEPAKWVARLRAARTDDHDLFLVTNMEAGHGGASGRFRRHRETALVYAFLLSHSPGVSGEEAGSPD